MLQINYAQVFLAKLLKKVDKFLDKYASIFR